MRVIYSPTKKPLLVASLMSVTQTNYPLTVRIFGYRFFLLSPHSKDNLPMLTIHLHLHTPFTGNTDELSLHIIHRSDEVMIN